MKELVQSLFRLKRPIKVEVQAEGNNDYVAGEMDSQMEMAGLSLENIPSRLETWIIWMSLEQDEVSEFLRERVYATLIEEEEGNTDTLSVSALTL